MVANTAGGQVKLQTDPKKKKKKSPKSLQMLSVIEGLLLYCATSSTNAYKTTGGGTGPHASLDNSSSFRRP